ncbi:type III-A CRISPR-associated RAMP protein Csm4 [Methylovulum psychrotolerans]|uniref:CRISPR system Cms protein Csm4 n=1 Tax=Methylovulum psychrotolerans TaxID=1704499 RepID=A0A2S5CIH1_9GAMM|nr:type III-A CRISPR-associated RAMP protein Csm4 [Methylovulum psychrotolerans]POZ50608.1 CRISPR type III-associated RAMP protein Csm4 [Methylovulum psychrotolerans]
MLCYRLHFTAPFHIDSRGDAFHERSETFIHSDTLSAALLSAWALLEPDRVAERAEQPPFSLSSAFPFYKDHYGQYHYFLPRALNTQAVQLPKERLQDAKKIKKLQWLEVALWRKTFTAEWLTGKTPLPDIKQGCLAFAKQTHLRALWAEEERPRLAIDRLTNATLDGQLFHLSRIWFDQDGGLYFLAKPFAKPAEQAAFEAALSLLGDSGIGADRSNGNGFFKWEHGQNPGLRLAKADDRAVALSLISPDIDKDCRPDWLEKSAYKLVSRGGWIGQSGLRKKRLRMFAEGSVFKRPLQGQVVDITPENAPNKVCRDGRGFFVQAG